MLIEKSDAEAKATVRHWQNNKKCSSATKNSSKLLKSSGFNDFSKHCISPGALLKAKRCLPFVVLKGSFSENFVQQALDSV